MDTLQIDSPQNPKIKHTLKLRKRSERDKQEKFIIEGYKECLHAKNAELAFEAFFFCESLFNHPNAKALCKDFTAKGISSYSCSADAFEKLSYRDTPDGILAVAKKFASRLEDINWQAPGLFLIAEGIEKPGNLGSILRTADAVGVSAVFVCDGCTDIFNPNTIRASVGTLFTQPVLEVDTETLQQWLTQKKIRSYLTTPDATQSLYETNFSNDSALLVGSEHAGASQRWLEYAEEKIYIPMQGEADSLNVSAATAIVLYEALRQRSGMER